MYINTDNVRFLFTLISLSLIIATSNVKLSIYPICSWFIYLRKVKSGKTVGLVDRLLSNGVNWLNATKLLDG